MKLSINQARNKFIATFNYSPEFAARVRSIPGARFNVTTRAWTLPLDIPTITEFKSNFPFATFDDEVKRWESSFINQANLNEEQKNHGPYTDTDFSSWDFKVKPYEHQLKALDLMINNASFALLHEMGCGKTWVAINLLSYLKRIGEGKPALVVCPLSVCSVWKDQIARHADNLTCQVLTGDRYERKKKLQQAADVYVINYEGLRIMEGDLSSQTWGTVICDESQKIKNRTAKQSKIACRFGRGADRRYILTGTMIVNNPLDAFGQFLFLDPAILGHNYFGFQNQYAVMVTHGRARFPVRFINIDKLAKKIAPWSHRVTKAECLDLPEKIYETRYVGLNAHASGIYKKLGSDLMVELNSGKIISAPIVLTKLLRFSQITAGFVTSETGEIEEVGYEKLAVLKELIEECEGKAVVWVKFKRELEMVCRVLETIHVSHVVLSGDTPQTEREENLKRFHGDDGLKVFVAQIEAGGTGIDLTPANTCIYMSNSYSLGTRLQSEDRLHRIGQKHPVTYIDVVAAGTIDEKIVALLRNKKGVADVINGDVNRKEFIQSLIETKEG